MSWHDAHRSKEPAGETALREELRVLLGMKPQSYFETESTPELVALAEELRKEAKRRNHTVRTRSQWMLMAAAVPLALAFGGVSLWGIAQKHKAEDLALVVASREVQIARMAASAKHQEAAAPRSNPSPVAPALLAAQPKATPVPKGKELVEPVERPANQILQETHQVKGH